MGIVLCDTQTGDITFLQQGARMLLWQESSNETIGWKKEQQIWLEKVCVR